MSNALSVNELIDCAHEFDGQRVEVVGLLTLDFEHSSLDHFPKAERRQMTETVDAAYYPSSVWIASGPGSIQADQEALARWTGKRVRVVGLVRTPKDLCGCGHFGRWGCEIEVDTIERL